MKAYQIKLLLAVVLVVVTTLAQAAVYNVPGDYPQVSDALAVAVDGDTIEISSGNYTDTYCWFGYYPLHDISIVGLGSSPAAVKYLVPEMGACWSIRIQSGWRLSNICVGSNNATNVIDVLEGATDVLIENVIVYPVHRNGILVEEDVSAEIRNVSVIDGGHWAIYTYLYGVDLLVENCYIKNFERGIGHQGTQISERYNCFDDVDYPTYTFTMDPTDIIGTAHIYPPQFLPPADSIVVDAGDPTQYDDDGTVVDIGAVWRRQCSLMIGWDAVPTRVPKIGEPPRTFTPGDDCALYYSIVKPPGPPVFANTPVQAYIALDVYHTYFFWPSWSEGTVDWEDYTVTDAATPFASGEIFNFVWPSDVGSASNLCFWGITTADTGEAELVIGPVAYLGFGYTE